VLSAPNFLASRHSGVTAGPGDAWTANALVDGVVHIGVYASQKAAAEATMQAQLWARGGAAYVDGERAGGRVMRGRKGL
jgi:hypothetical protein